MDHMLDLTVSELTEEDAKAICLWRYDVPYDIYNYPSWETAIAQGSGITNPVRRCNEFFAVRNDNRFIGYFRVVNHGQSVMIGLGLAPDMCGHHLGYRFMLLIEEVLQQRNPDKTAQLEVRTFNVRAIRCYESAGFVIKEKYCRDTPLGPGEFYLMELNKAMV